jgi:hypothetical protein
MHKIFVESKIISAGDFDLCWRTPDLTAAAAGRGGAVHPDAGRQGNSAVDKSLKLLADKSRTAYLPLDRYDVDMDLRAVSRRRSAGAGACCRSTA